MDAGRRQSPKICRRNVGRRDRPRPCRLHQDPEQIAGLRSRLGSARLYGRGGRLVPALGANKDRRTAGSHARDRAAGGPHPGYPDRGAGGERRHRAALRPSRQTAGDGRLGRRLRSVDPAYRRRQALRPRRRRRRLRDVRGDHRARSVARTGCAARARGDPDRGVRGVRQLRPAKLRRSSERPHRQPVLGRLPRFRDAAITTSCG